ncbi:MAG: outer membrane protein assembly factor BamB family protein [Actinomycetota bacterium]
MRAPRVPLTIVVALVTTLAVTLPADAGTGWPQDGYDSGRSNANTQDWRLRPGNVGKLRLLWSRSIRTADQGWVYEHIDLPVVRAAAYEWWQSEGVETPRSVALSVDTGRSLWLRSQEWAVAASSADTVYANAGSWRVLALDAATGERRWARWGMRLFAATPSIDRLVVRTHDGVGMIDASTGQDVWIRDGIAIDGYPLMSRGVVVGRADQDPDAILGLDAETGDTLMGATSAATALAGGTPRTRRRQPAGSCPRSGPCAWTTGRPHGAGSCATTSPRWPPSVAAGSS